LFPSAARAGSGGSKPSQIIDFSLRKAAAGLIGAACLQVAVALAVARSGYPAWFIAGFPVFLGLTAAGVIRLLYAERPTIWVVALCSLFAVFSLTATWAVRGHYTGALNVAEPLIGLGAFGAGLSAGTWSRPAAVGLIAVHRGALALAGTGYLGEYLILAMIECGSLCAAILGSTVVRAIAARLDADADALQRDAVADAAARTENQAMREHPRMVHDAPVDRLSMAGHGDARDSAEFRRACARGAEVLRGYVIVSEPAWTLAKILDDLVPDYEKRGLRVHLTHGDVTAYPEEPVVVTGLARAVHQCLVNVCLHSGQQDAYVVVTADSGRISIQVRDHGHGFIRATSHGFGSRMSIEQRMRDIGGEARIDSEVGAGTTVTLTWPTAQAPGIVPASRLHRLWQWARTSRWSRQRARERCEPLSHFMWQAIPYGLAVFAVFNAVQLAVGWPAYRHGWVPVVLLVVLVSVFMLIWQRSPGGVGPLLSALALVTGPLACLAIATQLSETALTGPANWVSGFCVVPLCLLPFSRPAEEMLLGVAALAAIQAFVMADAGRTLRDLHTIVMSGGAGAAIGIGVFFLVAVIRRMDTVNQDLKRQGLSVIQSRILQEGSRASLQVKLNNTETAAAAMLDGLANGTADVTDPGVQRRCAELADDLRRELRSLDEPSLLLAELLPGSGDLRWVIDDELNLSQRFGFQDRILLVRALRSVLELVPEGVAVRVLPLTGEVARVTVTSEFAELPATPEWRVVRQRFAMRVRPGTAAGSRPGSTPGKRWIYQWDTPVTSISGETQ